MSLLIFQLGKRGVAFIVTWCTLTSSYATANIYVQSLIKREGFALFFSLSK
jgi:hypothetical protein